jgi:hypothetical protein
MVPGGVSIRRLTDDRIEHGSDDSYGKDPERRIGSSPCLLESYGRQAEGYRPQGGGPRYLLPPFNSKFVLYLRLGIARQVGR